MPIYLSIAVPASVTDSHLAPLKSAGFSGVDLPFESVPALKPLLDNAGLSIACLTTALSLHHTSSSVWNQTERDILRAIDAAHTAAAPLIRLFPGNLPKGESPLAGAARLAPRLRKLAEAAATANVTLALQNAGSYLSAKSLWQLIEAVEHPRIAACLDVPSSTLIGESPVLTIPTLNSRVAHVRIWDYKNSQPIALGEGDAKLHLALDRLRGIGYAHAISYAPAKIDLADIDALKSAAHLLQLWSGLIQPEPPKLATPVASKAAH